MPAPRILLACVARAAVKHVGNFFTFGLAGDMILDAWDGFQREKRDEAARKHEVEQLAAASPDEARQAAREAVEREGASLSPEQQQRLEDFLTQAPVSIRRHLRRPADPSGTTMPASRRLAGADDLRGLLPAALPRFQAGDRPVAGADWELVELLGVGGFGEVWKARNHHLPSLPPVALKFCTDAQARQQLLGHEARVIAAVQGQGRLPGIVPLLHSYLSNDPPCLEYEYVAGGDLAGLIREWHEAGAAAPPRVAAMVQRLAEIVGRAHRLKEPVVHRDLKPSNVLVRQAGDKLELLVADFGIGGLAVRQAAERTRLGSRAPEGATVAGSYTALYASPQQMAGGRPDARDDVYSLGVVWYQALVGDLGRGAPTGEGWKRRLSDRGMSQGLLGVLVSCVEHEREDRPADAAVLAEEIRAAMSQAPAAVPVAPVQKPAVVAPPREIVNTIGMKLVLIPAGKFKMGSPPGEADRGSDEPQHDAEITRPFYLGVHQVTQGQYRALMGANPSYFSAQGDGKDKVKGLDTSRFPVEQVSWEEAVEFCRRLTEKERKEGKIVTEQEYRLPSEAEWEYSCRGGAVSYQTFHFGDSLSSHQANFNGNSPYGGASKGPYMERTCEVGSYQPNGYGLYDMHGNVWEWCADWYDANTYTGGASRIDPLGPPGGSVRVFRGGCWGDFGRDCRSAYRGGYAPSVRYGLLGFRVALVSSGG